MDLCTDLSGIDIRGAICATGLSESDVDIHSYLNLTTLLSMDLCTYTNTKPIIYYL